MYLSAPQTKQMLYREDNTITNVIENGQQQGQHRQQDGQTL